MGDLGSGVRGVRRIGNRGRGLVVRVGVASVAAGSAGLTLALSLCAGMMLGRGPAHVAVRVQAPGMSSAPTARVASASNTTFDSRWTTGNSSATPTTTASVSSSFDNRFSSASPAPRTRSLQPSLSFRDRFASAIASAPSPVQVALASVAPIIQPAPAAAPAPAPHTARRALGARVAPSKREERPAAATYRVASIGDAPIRTAYATPDAANRDPALDDSLLRKMTPHDPAPKDAGPHADMSHTAIYDITAHMVYLPSGRRLEAHSGLGEHMDDLGAVNQRSVGPTPPGIYDLTMRERSFHGVDAIRLNPVDNGQMHGRDGILAHPYMLGPNGQSNGCVSLKDYNEFLAAFRRGEFNRMVVVERLDETPAGQTATGWIAEKIRGLFSRS